MIERLVGLDSTASVIVQVKRLERQPRARVRIEYPQAEQREDETIELFEGANLLRAMLAKGIVLNDPLARRFDAGVGTGSCGGEGGCCTCAVEVVAGMSVLSQQKTQEAQMLRRFPRWRLACKASIAGLIPSGEDAEVTIRVQPRNFDGFYGEEEVDVDGVPLARDAGKR